MPIWIISCMGAASGKEEGAALGHYTPAPGAGRPECFAIPP